MKVEIINSIISNKDEPYGEHKKKLNDFLQSMDENPHEIQVSSTIAGNGILKEIISTILYSSHHY